MGVYTHSQWGIPHSNKTVRPSPVREINRKSSVGLELIGGGGSASTEQNRAVNED